MSDASIVTNEAKPSIQKLVDVFLSSLGRGTLAAYKRDLADFQSYLHASSITEAITKLLSNGAGMANLVALEYKNHLIAKNLQSSTVNRKLAALKSVVRLGRTLGLASFSLEVRSIKVTPYRDTRGLGRCGVEEILELIARRNDNKSIRDHAIVHLLYSLALRVSEIVNLDLEDMDLNAKTLAVLGKGKTDKIKLDLPLKVVAALQAWLTVRGTNSGALFYNLDRLSKRRKRITRHGIRYVVKYYGLKLNIKNSHPHSFRHSGISTATSEGQRAGIRIDEVLQFSRHSSLRNLQPYLDKERDVQGRLARLVADTVDDKDNS